MFKRTNTSTILRLADNANIPAEPANSDYAEYLRWVASGNTPQPADVPVIGVPQSVTRFQARAALSRAGLFTTVHTAMTAFAVDDERRLAWEDAQEFRRTSPTMLQMAAALGLSDAQLDALFTTAASIEA